MLEKREREKKRRLTESDRGPGNPSREERASSGAKIEAERVEPSSSTDHFRNAPARDRPVEPEEEEKKKFRVSDPTGQKRKTPEGLP